MNINLNNYETFFLMYVDNELSAGEMLLVDEFILQFPYLEVELQILQEMVLPLQDTVVFDKEQLYRSAAAEEIINEAMLLHLDNELKGADKESLLHQIEENKMLQLNWSLLKRSQLDANEQINFPYKSILYRKEKGRLVTVNFLRWAVAAALIAAGFFVGMSINKNQEKGQTEITISSEGKQHEGDTSLNDKKNLVNKEAVSEKETNQALAADDKSQNNKTVVVNTIAKTKENQQKNKPGEGFQNQQTVANNQVAIEKEKVQLAENKVESLNIINPANNDVARVKEPSKVNNSSIASIKVKTKPEGFNETVDINTTIPVQNNFAKTTALIEEEEQNDDHILLISEEKLANSKAGVFFKKLKRTVARNTKVTTGKSLKIAGLEFAVK